MTDNNKQVKISRTQHNNLLNYKELLNKRNKKNKIKLTDLVNNILEDYFKDKLLTNSYILPDRELYFNYLELMREKEVKATVNRKFKDLDYLFRVRKIPNNLDTFNYEYDSYCYDDIKGFHKGIYIYNFIGLDSWYYEGYIHDEEIILVFEYDENKKELTIGLVEKEKINLYFNNREKEILLKLLQDQENYKKLILQDNSKINAEVFLSGFEVIVSNAQLTEIETNKEISEAIEKYVNNLTDNINNLNNKQIDVLKIFKELFNENNHLKHFIFRQRDKLEFILKKVDELEKQKVEITEKDFKKLTQKRKK